MVPLALLSHPVLWWRGHAGRLLAGEEAVLWVQWLQHPVLTGCGEGKGVLT